MKSGMNNGFDLMALYGRNTVCSDKDGECRIYHLNNETGAGMITVYNVFTGISAAFNDIHMGYCSKKQNSAPDVIEINHCMEGRYECSIGDRLCCYMSHGDVAVKAADIGSENSCFPTRHYHGISIFIETDKLSDELLAIMKALSIDMDRIRSLVSNENKLFRRLSDFQGTPFSGIVVCPLSLLRHKCHQARQFPKAYTYSFVLPLHSESFGVQTKRFCMEAREPMRCSRLMSLVYRLKKIKLPTARLSVSNVTCSLLFRLLQSFDVCSFCTGTFPLISDNNTPCIRICCT